MASGDDQMDESDELSDEETWDENEMFESPSLCLFCDHSDNKIESLISHCQLVHNFSFEYLMKKFCMDCYSFIKFVNYVRKTSPSPEKILDLETVQWDDNEYMKPVEEFDPWLMFDFEEYFSSVSSGNNEIPRNGSGSYEEKLSHLEAQLFQKSEEIAQLTNQITQMKNIVHNILQDDVNDIDTAESYSRKHNNSYFDSYSHPGIHYDMLADEVRTLNYRTAILNNSSVFSEKTVLDLGCGTGILSMFAVSAGAKKVIAVDNSDIIYYTMDIVRENQMENKIQVIKSRIEDKIFPGRQVDIIISEWMGYFLLFEGMIDSVIYARDNYLKPGGIIVPDKCQLFIQGANDEEAWKIHYKFWSDVYGYRMSILQKEVVKQAVVDIISKEKLVTSCALISSFNLYECSVKDTDFLSPFELIAITDTTVTTLVGYFNVFFNLEEKNYFSTGPLVQPTHWKQTLFHISEPICMKKGEKLIGKLSCKRKSENNRALFISIFINEKRYDYDLD